MRKNYLKYGYTVLKGAFFQRIMVFFLKRKSVMDQNIEFKDKLKWNVIRIRVVELDLYDTYF